MSDSSDELKDEDLAGVSLGSEDDSTEGKPVRVGKTDYVAQKPSQVSFNKGQRIIVMGASENGWFRGRLEESLDEGLFPEAYTVDASDATMAAELSTSGAPMSPGGDTDVLMICKCLQDYNARNEQELSFKAHDRVEVLEAEGNIWKARIKGRKGLIDKRMLEEDKGYTLRKAAEKKEGAKGQFRERRTKETSVLELSKKGSGDIEALKKEQERLKSEREKLQQDQEEKKAARERTRLSREGQSFGDRMKQKSDQKKLEAAAKVEAEKKAATAKKVDSAVSAWLGSGE